MEEFKKEIQGKHYEMKQYRLETVPKKNFGEAAKKIQQLVFMIRDNEDVFLQFCKMSTQLNNCKLYAETFANFMFNDLV